MFYFLWLGRSGDLGPFDITKILAQDPDAMTKPESPLWGPLHYPHHWGESIFGYYRNDDDGVLRKHAQMLADAGVDAVVFDVTNQVTYPQSWKALGRVFDEARRNGERVPKIAFLCPFWDPKKVVRELWEQLYEPGLYPDLWFQWEGKPVILADPAPPDQRRHRTDPPDDSRPLDAGRTLGQTFTVDHPFDAVSIATPTWETKDSGATLTLYRKDAAQGERLAGRAFDHVEDNAWQTLTLDKPCAGRDVHAGDVGASRPDRLVEKRARQSAQGRSAGRPLGRGRRLHPPRPAPRRDDGEDPPDLHLPEAAARLFPGADRPSPVELAGGPSPARVLRPAGRSPSRSPSASARTPSTASSACSSNPRSHGRSFENGREPGPEGRDDTGKNFNEQWRRALEIDPPLVFVTGWNEWIAGRFDAEVPARGLGSGHVLRPVQPGIQPRHRADEGGPRRRLLLPARRQRPPLQGCRGRSRSSSRRRSRSTAGSTTGSPSAPEFRDTIGDPVQRDFAGWERPCITPTRPAATTSSRPRRASTPTTSPSRSRREPTSRRRPTPPGCCCSWTSTAIRRPAGWDTTSSSAESPRHAGRAVLEGNVGGAYEWGTPIEVAAAASGNQHELAIPLSALGLKTATRSLDFKWADGIAQTGDWSDFTLNGDVAPDDRFNYRAVFAPASR